MKRVAIAATAILLGAAAIGATSFALVRDDDDDSVEYTAFVSAGTSLSAAIAAAEAETGAKAKSAEIEKEDGSYVVEVELFDANGEEVETIIDLHSGAVIRANRQARK